MRIKKTIISFLFIESFTIIRFSKYQKTPLLVPRTLTTFIFFLGRMPGVQFATVYLSIREGVRLYLEFNKVYLIAGKSGGAHLSNSNGKGLWYVAFNSFNIIEYVSSLFQFRRFPKFGLYFGI